MDSLHELIHSLTPSEKGYFKKYASAQNGTDYLKLFDAIAGMKSYDEEKLLFRFKTAGFVKHLARTKNYLFQSIIRALLNYHEESSPKVIIANLLSEAEMLFARGMLQQARKRVDKAKIMAIDGEWFMLLLDVLNQQGRLSDFRMYTPEELDIDHLHQEIAMATSQMTNFFELVALNHEQKKISDASFIFRKEDRTEKLIALRNSALLKDEAESKCIRAKLLFNYIHYLNRLLLQQYREALSFAKRYLALIKENENISLASPQFQLQAYNMVISCLQFIPEPDLREKYLNDLRNLQVKGNWMEAAKFQNYAGQALYFYHENFRKKEFLETAQEVKHQLNEYRHILKTDLKLGIYVTLTEGYLKFGNYAEAIEVIEWYRQNPPKDTRNDYQNYLLLFYLIAQYETGNYQLVRNLISNVGQFMKRNKEFSEAEALMLKVFSTVLDVPDNRTRNAELKELKAGLKKTGENSGNPRLAELIAIMMPFIESRIKGIKYHEFFLHLQKAS